MTRYDLHNSTLFQIFSFFSLSLGFSSCFFVFFSCHTTPFISFSLPSFSPLLVFTLQYFAHLYVCTTWKLYPFYLHLIPVLSFSSFLHLFLPSVYPAPTPPSLRGFRHELITPHLPSLAASRSLCLVLMTSVLGSVTVETKVVLHRDVTNCTMENVCVCVCVRMRVCLCELRSGTVIRRCK